MYKKYVCLPYSIPCDTIWLWIIATEFTLVQPKLRLSTFLIRYHDLTSLKYRLQIKFEWENGVIPRVPISYCIGNMECVTPKIHPKLNRLKCPLLKCKLFQCPYIFKNTHFQKYSESLNFHLILWSFFRNRPITDFRLSELLLQFFPCFPGTAFPNSLIPITGIHPLIGQMSFHSTVVDFRYLQFFIPWILTSCKLQQKSIS